MAEFGYHTIGASADVPSQNCVWCKATSTPASNGTLTAISVHCKINVGTPTINCAIYSDNAGAPGNRLAFGTAQTVPGSYAWVDVPVSGSIVASTQYWLAIIVPGGQVSVLDVDVHFDDQGATTELYFISNGTPQGGSTFPADGTGATSAQNARWSIYATFTPDGAAGSPFFARVTAKRIG